MGNGVAASTEPASPPMKPSRGQPQQKGTPLPAQPRPVRVGLREIRAGGAVGSSADPGEKRAASVKNASSGKPLWNQKPLLWAAPRRDSGSSKASDLVDLEEGMMRSTGSSKGVRGLWARAWRRSSSGSSDSLTDATVAAVDVDLHGGGSGKIPKPKKRPGKLPDGRAPEPPPTPPQPLSRKNSITGDQWSVQSASAHSTPPGSSKPSKEAPGQVRCSETSLRVLGLSGEQAEAMTRLWCHIASKNAAGGGDLSEGPTAANLASAAAAAREDDWIGAAQAIAKAVEAEQAAKGAQLGHTQSQSLSRRPMSVESAQVADAQYIVDNHLLKSESKGLTYYLSKALSDKAASSSAVPWGSTVAGLNEGDGWLRVGSLYLPFEVDGLPVLRRKAPLAVATLRRPDRPDLAKKAPQVHAPQPPKSPPPAGTRAAAAPPTGPAPPSSRRPLELPGFDDDDHPLKELVRPRPQAAKQWLEGKDSRATPQSRALLVARWAGDTEEASQERHSSSHRSTSSTSLSSSKGASSKQAPAQVASSPSKGSSLCPRRCRVTTGSAAVQPIASEGDPGSPCSKHGGRSVCTCLRSNSSDETKDKGQRGGTPPESDTPTQTAMSSKGPRGKAPFSVGVDDGSAAGAYPVAS